MKKLFYSMFALAALAMTNTSCSDEMENTANSNEVAVTFNVQLENTVGSRAVGDGTTATELQYAVYKVDAEGNTIGSVIEALSKETTVNADLTAEVSFTLVKGQTYNFLFWAQSPDNEFYTVDKASGVVTVTYGTAANDEKRDAFFKVRKDLKVTGPINETIVLKRPFAQVNVGTSIGSLKDAATADVNINKSLFIVEDAATTLDTYTGAASNKQMASFTLADIIESDATDETGDLKNVNGTDYEYLAMNYILVADETDSDETDEYGVGENKQLINATFQINDGEEIINTFEIPNVPVQRNWRTNIIGDITNETVTFNIVIDPKFDNDHNYITDEELAYVLKNGGEYTFPTNGETTIETAYVVENGANVILNLNGNQIKTTNGSDAFIVKDGTLTIKGKGSVTTEDKTAGYAIIVDGANAVANIYDGTYTIGLDDVAVYGTGACNSAVYTKNGGKANIYGGTYQVATEQTAPDAVSKTRYLINEEDHNRKTITIYGGTFVEFNPANNVAEGANTNFVADGYKSTQSGDNYIVTKE